MRILQVTDCHSLSEIKFSIRGIKGYNDVVDWKIIEAVKMNPGIDASDIAKVLCISIKKVYKVIQEYNKKGVEFKQDSHWGGRRRENCYLSVEQEAEILSNVSEQAAKGLILTAKDIREEFEKQIGQSVSEDYLWKVLKRHNWRKKSPRPEHPNSNIEEQEEFKKNSKKTWRAPL